MRPLTVEYMSEAVAKYYGFTSFEEFIIRQYKSIELEKRMKEKKRIIAKAFLEDPDENK